MQIFEVSLRRFVRGFEHLTVQPIDHVALIGEPRAGRSDLIEGLRRVLTSDGVQHTTPSELDFWMVDTDERAEVEVVLGDLGADLEQDFVDRLEAWDFEQGALAAPRPRTESSAVDDTAWVLWLCYRAKWDDEQEQATHWVDFPDESDPASGTCAKAPRRLHDLLPVKCGRERGRPLRLGPRPDFRRLLEGTDSGSLAEAFDDLVDSVARAGEALAKTADIKASVGEVLR